jgi:hypothetical protein
VQWAKAARLVRVSGTKLMPVKKNAALAERPLDLVLALLEAYPRLGRPLFPRNTWRQSLVGDEFTDISRELTTRLLRSAGPCPLDELSDIAYHAIEARYMLTGLTALQHDSLRRMIAAPWSPPRWGLDRSAHATSPPSADMPVPPRSSELHLPASRKAPCYVP